MTAPISTGEWSRDGFVISTDRDRLDRDMVWAAIAETYWGRNLTREVFERSVDNAFVFGLYVPDGGQIGFARVVSDCARVAWLSDLFVLQDYRGRGLGQWLVRTLLDSPAFDGIGRWLLATHDARDFYRSFGFVEIDPKRFMLRRDG